MGKLSEVKKQSTDRAKVDIYLDLIGENDVLCRNEVLSQCSVDIQARKYYVDRCEEMQKMRSHI